PPAAAAPPPAVAAEGPAASPTIAPPARTAPPCLERVAAVASVLRRTLAKLLFLSEGEIGDRDRFIDLGLDSILAVEWTRRISEPLGIRLTPTRLYDHPTVSELSRAVADLAVPATPSDLGERPHEPASEAPGPGAPLPPLAASHDEAVPPGAPSIE